MKSVSFHRNKSLIRIVNEQSKKNKTRNWDKIIYLCLLTIFVLFLGYYLLNKFLFIHAFGQVIIESTHIRLTDDARIIELYKNEGDSIMQNDTLFSYALDRDDDINSQQSNGTTISSITGGTTNDWWVKEVYALKKNIVLNNIELSENTTLINTYKLEIKRITNEVILDVLPKTRLDIIQNEIIKLSTVNQKLNKENDMLQSLIKSLGPTTNKETFKKVNKRLTTSIIGVNDDAFKLAFSNELLSEPKYFKSPISGIATRIFIHNYETALKNEEIISIHQAHPAFIKTYFEQEDLQYFKVGDEFNIEFPDGSNCKGYLKRFYIATYILPDEFQKKYEPTTRSIAGDIYPVDSADIVKWKIFYKMSVDISKIKFY